jgi:hypothetical protein
MACACDFTKGLNTGVCNGNTNVSAPIPGCSVADPCSGVVKHTVIQVRCAHSNTAMVAGISVMILCIAGICYYLVYKRRANPKPASYEQLTTSLLENGHLYLAFILPWQM